MWLVWVSLPISLISSTLFSLNVLDLVLKPSKQGTHRHLCPDNHAPKRTGHEILQESPLGEDGVFRNFVFLGAPGVVAGRMWGRSTLESSRETDPSLSLVLLKAVIKHIPVPRGFSSESL